MTQSSDIHRCRREISAIEAKTRVGNQDLPGLFLALSDWSMELRILQNKKRRRAGTQRRKPGKSKLV